MNGLTIGLNAVIAALEGSEPRILVLPAGRSLPFDLFDPARDRTLEKGLRSLVATQTGLDLGYVEQLYTFGNLGRVRGAGGAHIVSVSYLTLTRSGGGRGLWHNWYAFLPWEDHRSGIPPSLKALMPKLMGWARGERSRMDRVRLCFAPQRRRDKWDEEKTLERYELLYEAGLAQEARRDKKSNAPELDGVNLGVAMLHDHRRIAATALGRLRGKLKYRPVIFEMMPDFFTLYELQKAAEAIAGMPLHKQNFRRLVEREKLVERTGRTSATGGRPAAQFRFRREIWRERPAPAGMRLTAKRN